MPAWEPPRPRGPPAWPDRPHDGAPMMRRRRSAILRPAGDRHRRVRHSGRRGATRGGGGVHAGDRRPRTTSGPTRATIGVTVQITFTNTTPDPAGQFSIFHRDPARRPRRRHGRHRLRRRGEPAVDVAVNARRGQRRHDRAPRGACASRRPSSWSSTTPCADGDDPQLRVRPSVVVFPAWSFGTDERGQRRDPERLRGARRRRPADRGRGRRW